MKGNGDDRGGEGTCPHNCVRCRAIELGYSGRALTPTEFIEVHGGLVEPSREPRVQYSTKTLEAGLAEEVARVEFQAARRARMTLEAARGDLRRKLRSLDPATRRARAFQLDGALRAAVLEETEARKRLVSLANRYQKLVRYESQLHKQAIHLAEVGAQKVAAAAARQAAREARKKKSDGLLSLLRRSDA